MRCDGRSADRKSEHEAQLDAGDPDPGTNCPRQGGERQPETHHARPRLRALRSDVRNGAQCRKYFTLWDPDHRIEVAPGQYRALFADLFDRAVTTTAYSINDYRTTPGLAARLMEASGTEPPAAPSALGRLGRILTRK